MTSNRYLWSILGGLTLVAAFPTPGLAGLAWVAPAFILFSALGRTGGEVWRIGYAGGLAYYLGSLYWLLHIPFPAGAAAGWLALSAYRALYPATWVWLCWKTFATAGTAELTRCNPSAPGLPGQNRAMELRPPAVESVPTLLDAGLPPGDWRSNTIVRQFLATPVPHRVFWALACAFYWVALEMVLARLFTGFPWNLLGVSQYQVLPLIQIAQVTGVYGVSFLIVWFSVSLASAALNLAAHPTQSKAWLGDLILPLVAVVATVAFGSSQLAHAPLAGRTLKAVLIQPSIPQTLIWDTNQNTVRFQQLIELSERALTQTSNAQLMVWPEAAVPNMLRYEFDVYQAVTNLAMRHHVWVILGSDDAERRPDSAPLEVDYFNSSFILDPTGRIAGTYRKRRLVIFGEYIPLERWLPLMKYLTPVGGSFAEGLRPVPFHIPDLETRTSVLICFEDVFPHLVREYVEDDTDFLLNLTNNGWFGESAAQWQHAANAVFRAVENQIPLVRCANNGLTCWVDSRGGMHEVFFPGTSDIYRAGFKTVEVPLLPRGQQRQRTFYTRHGDVFGWACVAIAATAALASLPRQRRGRQ